MEWSCCDSLLGVEDGVGAGDGDNLLEAEDGDNLLGVEDGDNLLGAGDGDNSLDADNLLRAGDGVIGGGDKSRDSVMRDDEDSRTEGSTSRSLTKQPASKRRRPASMASTLLDSLHKGFLPPGTRRKKD